MFDESIRRVLAPVQYHVLDPPAKFSRYLLVHLQHPGVDDPHVQARLNRVIQKHRVNRLPHLLVPPKRKRHVTHAPAHLTIWQCLLNDPRRLHERHRVFPVFLHPRRDRKRVGIENNIARIKTDLFGQNVVRPGADRDPPLGRISLAFLVKRHHDHRRSIPQNQPSVLYELFFAFLEADRIDHPFALQAFESRFDDRPFRAIDHHRNPRDIRL